MAFRKDLTTSANAAIMTSGGIVSALVAAGIVKTADAATKAAVTIAEGLITVAAPIVEADNAGFEAAEASAPAKSTSSKSSTSKSTGAKGEKLVFGVFKGQTLEQVVELSAEDAEERFGYKQGSGLDYVTWLAENANETKVMRAAGALIEAA